uniref:Vromindoline VIN3 n=1 Tax=Avena ventricosa TaxID=146535 RepID=W0NT06_9POAL|nr:vromindoline VIN3 [Avena ventricosa]
MKALFLLALLALAASAASAQYAENSDSHGGWDGCTPEKARLKSCKDYVVERCLTLKDIPITWPWKWWKGGCESEVRSQCCMELNQITPHCRCKAIWRAVQGELGGFLGFQQSEIMKQVHVAQSLPSTCNMGPNCNFPTNLGYY